MSSLQGKRAIVTGGSRGIGAAIARRLAAEGAHVAFTFERSADCATEVARSIEATGQKSLAIQADSADAQAVRAAVDAAAQAFGGLDILVNNAGIFPTGDIAEVTLEDVDRTLAVNVRAVVIASQAAAAHMREGGRIISIGSSFAERVMDPGVSLYALSKAALIGWTKGLARDLGPKGITVNIVHPGSTDTDMNPADGPGAEAQRAQMAIPRFGRPEDIAAMVAFVAGPEAGFITGAGLAVDGGVNT
jgi:NAD(P)-dependent dehydrogenase (short-subunit alcohol dehydrogenase family)